MRVCALSCSHDRTLIRTSLAIILGNYLYIDGGQVAFQHNDSVLDYEPGMLRVVLLTAVTV